MTVKKSDKKKIVPGFVWDPANTDEKLAAALKTLGRKYPQLSSRKGGTKLVFRKGFKTS